jgi:hypothetical protein
MKITTGIALVLLCLALMVGFNVSRAGCSCDANADSGTGPVKASLVLPHS